MLTSAIALALLSACGGSTAPPTPDTPSPRFEQAMVYDAVRHQVLMYGGMNGGIALGDLWAWNGSAWERLASAGPPARFAAVLAWDPAGARVLMYGGTANGTHLTDLWSWNGSAWTELSHSGGPELGHASGGWDAARGRLVIHRGWSGTAFQGDTWEWDGAQWSMVSTSVPTSFAVPLPAPMLYDTLRHALLMLVGDANAKTEQLWQWSGTQWTVVDNAPATDPPAGIAQRAANDLLMLIAGSTTMTTWHWNGSAWADLAVTGPPKRFIAKLAYDPGRNQVVLFGGMNASGAGMNDTWVFSGNGGWLQLGQ